METSQTYSPEEIILHNLEELSDRRDRIAEQETAHLRELAAGIASGFDDAASFLASLPEHRLPATTNGGERLSPELRVRLCLELRKQLPALSGSWKEFFFPALLSPDPAPFPRVTFQRSRRTDAAFLRFSGLMHNARAYYAHNFRSICEDVSNGLSEYCILPFENETDGQLHTFRRLTEEYDLRIAAVCKVTAEEGDKGTRFALLSKQTFPFRDPSDAPLFFAFSASLSGGPGADDLLRAMKICGLSPLRAEILPDASGTPCFRGNLFVGQGDLPAFLLYLSMEIPHYDPIGLYPDLCATND